MPTDVQTDLPVSDSWRIQPKYLCRACGHTSRIHPETNHIWGCMTCGMTTASVFLSFMPADEFDYPTAARTIALWLGEFCDEDMPYPVMVADAARRAAREIEQLRGLT